METFADVLHAIIDTVFSGDAAEKAHGIIDGSSGTRSEAAAAEAARADDDEPETTEEAPADEAAETEEAPPTQ